MAKRVNETLDMQSAAKIINLPVPSSANDAARKADVDAVQTSLTFMENPVRVVSATNINVASPGAAIDGVALTAGDRVLLTAQTTATQNGTWVWNGAAIAMTRTTDVFVAGTIVIIGPDGTNYKNTMWVQTTDAPSQTNNTWIQLPFEATTAGAGLTKTGNQLSLTVPVTVANGGTGATSTAAAKTSLGFVTTYEANFGDGASTSFTIPHNLGNKFCGVVVVNNSTNADEDCTITRTDANNLVLSSEVWTASPPAANAYHVACRG